MKNLYKKTALTMGLAALLALSACESKEKKAEREADAEKERVATVERERTEKQRQEDKLTLAIYDSLMNVPNTVDDLTAKQAEVYCNDFKYGCGMGTKHELDSLTNVRMLNVLNQRVVNTAKPIAERHLKELYVSLATYNLGVDANSRIAQILSGEPYDANEYSGILLNFYGEEAADTVYGRECYDFDIGKQDFVSAVLYGADTAQYGAGRKAEIVKIIENRYVQMMADLKANRIAVARQFADYYPVLDLNRVPKQYRKLFADYDPALCRDEGSTWYSYWNWMLTPSFAIEKSVNVYDSKLNPEFFNVPGATYKLVQVSKGNWKVVRTLKSGKKDETPVFAHDVDYTTSLNTWVADDVKQGDSYFSAQAGTNLGVHISVTEYEYVARATKSDKVPDSKGERAARIEHLQKKDAEVHVLDSIAHEYSVAARENARKMAQRRLGHNR